MSDPSHNEVSVLVRRVGEGDETAMPLLIEAAYRELRALAGKLFRDQPEEHTLQPTALVHELCVNLLSRDTPDWNDRKHFIRAAAAAMRNLLTDHARAKRADKRGGPAATVLLQSEDIGAPAGSSAIDVIVLDETVSRLAEMDPRLGRVFELRFLANLSVRHTAELEGISERTVELDSKFIRAWLHKELRS